MSIQPVIRVVIAEDDALVATLTKQELSSAGFTVLATATDGHKAVALTKELKPDVVLMDITMPELDGIAAAIAIQTDCPTPVVILTAHQGADFVARATAAGVGAMVIKPPQSDELKRAITIAIARHADLMELRRLNSELQQALADVKTLSGLLPICCGCKKIRDDKGYWDEVEVYISKHTTASFTHGICPACAAKYYPDFAAKLGQ